MNKRNMLKKTTLSVIIPNYNHGHHLKELLPSLLTQSRPPEEIIVVDDGSTDDSVQIIEAIAQNHSCIKLYKNDCNRGVVYTLNHALNLATGEYVTFPSADNLVLPRMYEKSLDILEQYPQAGLCCSDPMILDDSNQQRHLTKLELSREPTYFSPEDAVRLGREKHFCAGNLCHTVVVRKEAMQTVALTSEYYISKLKWHCDFFAINAIVFRYGFCYVPEALSVFRHVSGSYSNKRQPWAIRKEVYRYMIELLNMPCYADIKHLFKRSTVLAEFTYSMFLVLITKPSLYEYFTLKFTIRVLHATYRIWIGVLRFWISKIPFARRIFRFLKKKLTTQKSQIGWT